ncbi:MAG: polyamine aminopropyltransferase [Firmicutes bacterium]|nr:polyamine aminopropyltransferase [Bacillota bacterium]
MDLWYTENHTDNVKFSIRIKEQLYHDKSPFQDIDFFTSDEFGTFFTLDGLMMVTEKDEFIYHDMISHIPMAVNPEIKNILVIGGGDGGTVRELTRYKSIKNIDMVEIDEMVVQACKKYLPITSSQLDDPRVNLFFEDGVAFIERKNSEYDLIIIDSTDPIGPGEGLFTKSFYTNCYNALKDDGILINQHESPYYERDKKNMNRAHKRIKETFEIAEVYEFHMPTYPSGHWLFGFASKKFHPIADLNEEAWLLNNLDTKYYNLALHKAAFALPTYVKKALEE